MSLEDDLHRVTLQEQRLQFDQFGPAQAWDLGQRLKATAENRQIFVAIDISSPSQQLFHFAMPGTTPNNADWIRRKRNTVFRFYRSSFAIGLQMQQRQTTLATAYNVPAGDYADAGGGFPIAIKGTGCVGAVTVSGLPQREDHRFLVDVLAEMLGQDIADITLTP
ncbi:MAG TPA: heme-degrading domain-containing protein [Telmatospirillum sp.]|nr:heme-degrading domain-containing protein [Telmatospirillum sp.]